MEYARNALEIYQEGNLIWVQDYNLMMVPGFFRMQMPEAAIGYFQHIPFPSNEFYSIFPYRNVGYM
jgi:trehalose 6-phosphate synthase/phosphatase